MSDKKTILFVDDEPLNLMLFNALFNHKYDIVTAISGEDGLEKLRANPAILFVISDMKMPGMNGIAFITRAKVEFPAIDYAVLTGYEINEEITNAVASRLIVKYLKKPFEVNEIEATIEVALK